MNYCWSISNPSCSIRLNTGVGSVRQDINIRFLCRNIHHVAVKEDKSGLLTECRISIQIPPRQVQLWGQWLANQQLKYFFLMAGAATDPKPKPHSSEHLLCENSLNNWVSCLECFYLKSVIRYTFCSLVMVSGVMFNRTSIISYSFVGKCTWPWYDSDERNVYVFNEEHGEERCS